MIFLKNVAAFVKPEINYNMIIRKITPPDFPACPAGTLSPRIPVRTTGHDRSHL